MPATVERFSSGETPAVLARRVAKHYREGDRVHEVLHDLNVAVARGESVAILGRSGCGKSTLLNLLSGIDVPDSGEIRVDGCPIHTLPERRRTLFRRRNVGFVFQFLNLIPTLTVRENLQLPLELNGIVDTVRVGQLLDIVALGERADSFPDVLSGGEQQRVAIARALVHRPTLILADEPTGNLDERTGNDVLDLLLAAVREQATTLVMVTHSSEMAGRADRCLRLEGGRLC